VVGVLAVSSQADAHWIDQLYVHPAQGRLRRGRHVAGARAGLGRSARRGLPVRLYTFQANQHAREFYERHGFVAVALGDGADNEERCPDVLYERPAAQVRCRHEHRTPTLSPPAAMAAFWPCCALGACSTQFGYNATQQMQKNECQKLQDREERMRCEKQRQLRLRALQGRSRQEGQALTRQRHARGPLMQWPCCAGCSPCWRVGAAAGRGRRLQPAAFANPTTAAAGGPLGAAPAAAMPPADLRLPREFRAAWVATVANIDWPSKPGLSAQAQRAEATGHARPRTCRWA
jgi:hypothetical protein